jgi:hypothetical protein
VRQAEDEKRRIEPMRAGNRGFRLGYSLAARWHLTPMWGKVVFLLSLLLFILWIARGHL